MIPLFAWADGAKVAPKAEKPEDVEVEAHFLDGTTVRRAVLKVGVEIKTKYGSLTVPVSAIRRIEFGLHVPEETAKRIEAAVKKLGSERFEEREAATKELVGLGAKAYQPLQNAAQSKDKEVARRAQEALERIAEDVPEEQLQTKPDDVIYTKDCVLTGRIQNPVLKVRTEYFGELQFKLSDLREVHSMAVSRAAVAVDAAQFHHRAEKWFDTGITVEADTGLVITATGQVDLAPQQGPIHTSPDGRGDLGATVYGIAIGGLVGRIGEKGPVFGVGSRFDGRVAVEGKLYLQVISVPNGSEPSGSFQVKIAAGHHLVPVAKEKPASGMVTRTSAYGSTAVNTGMTSVHPLAPAPPLRPPVPMGITPPPHN
jgi:hypothetical protein